MSADRWATCPQCAAQLHKNRDNEYKRIMASYATIPVEQFTKQIDEYNARLKEESKGRMVDSSLREDYEVYTTVEGKFYVSYSCRCENCKWGHDFNHEAMIPIDPTG